jgi:type VI protein secretion system component Hcp
MSDPKHEQQTEEEELTADLTVPDAQAESVGGGEETISFNYNKVHIEYKPQNP